MKGDVEGEAWSRFSSPARVEICESIINCPSSRNMFIESDSVDELRGGEVLNFRDPDLIAEMTKGCV